MKNLNSISKYREKRSRNFWDNKDNRRNFMDELGKKLGYKKIPDYYKITREIMYKNGGARLYDICGSSSLKVLRSVYPDYDWIPWKLVQVSKGFWTLDNKRTFFDWLGPQLGIETREDWY